MEEETKEEKLQRKKAAIKAVSGTAFGVLGIVFLFLGAYMQDRGIPDRITIPVILSGFFGCNMIALVLLFKSAPELIASDMMKNLAIRNRHYEEAKLSELWGMEKEHVMHRLFQNRFRRIQEDRKSVV